MTDNTVSELAILLERQIDDTKIHLSQFSMLNRDNGLLTSYNNYSIQTHSQKPRVFQSHFTLQIYTATELKEMLFRNGFATIGQYGIDGSEFLENESINILTIARKE